MTLKRKIKRYDVPAIKHNRRKVAEFKAKKFRRKTDMLPLMESNYLTLKQIQRQLSNINKRLSKLEEPDEIWI